MTSVKVRIVDDRIKDNLPKYQTPGSAGIDLRAAINEPITVAAGQTVLIPTGMHIFIDNPGLVGMIFPRSGLGHKNGIVLGNLTGVIDSDYQGQLMVSIWNRNSEGNDFTIQPLDRIAQYVVVPVVQVGFDIVESFDATERGEGGFGHSGTK